MSDIIFIDVRENVGHLGRTPYPNACDGKPKNHH